MGAAASRLATASAEWRLGREGMGRSDEKGDVVLVRRRMGSNGLDRRHPEGGDEDSEHLQDSHSVKETASRTRAVSPARAISVATAMQCGWAASKRGVASG